MAKLHFLNVRHGDCTIIEHNSGHVTMVDVNNARIESTEQMAKRITEDSLKKAFAGLKGDFGQRHLPENPISYMQARSIDSVFRFILTHPDMDHMDGIKDVFAEFSPPNFWDTANTCDKDSDDWDSAPYREEDWKFYCKLRSSGSTKRLVYHSAETPCQYWKDDGLFVLAPTPDLISAANECGEWNDSSYVLLYNTAGLKIVISGDSHDETWAHILENHGDRVKNVDLLLAPHHGRHSDRSFEFLDVLKPRLTLFGNARSEHLAYSAWSSRKLPVITNNQAGSIIFDFSEKLAPYFVTNEKYAKAKLDDTAYFDEAHQAWMCGFLDLS
jgi:competence protein ComEC